MFKTDIISVRTERSFSCLGGTIGDLVHSFHRNRQQVQHTEIDQIAAHGLIQAGSHQQEGEEFHYIQPALQKQCTADDGHRADTDLQNQLRGYNESGLAEFRTDGFFLHIIDSVVQLCQIAVLCVAALQIPRGFDEFLHGVVQLHFGG